MKLLIIFLLSFSYSTAQISNQAEIDEELTNSRNALIYKEKRIAKVLSDFNEQIVNCSNSLKSNTQLKELTCSLDNFAAIIQLQKTVNNFLPYENISTCADINRKITMLDFEQKMFQTVSSQVSTNITAIYNQYNNVVRKYSLSVAALGGVGSQNQQNVFAIIQKTSGVISEINSYNPLLTQVLGRVSYFNAILSAFKKYYCQCLQTVAWTGYDSTIENNTELIESQLKKFETRIASHSNLTLSRVKSALQVATEVTLSTSLQSLQTTLANTMTVSDYTKITWPNIRYCNDMWNRIRFLEFKRLQYLNIIPSANLNFTYLTIYQSNSNSSSQCSLNQVQLALNSTTNLRTYLQVYVSQLVYSVGRISRMISDFNLYGDTHCSCGSSEEQTTSSETTQDLTSSTSTSTSKATTESTSTESTSISNPGQSTTAGPATISTLSTTTKSDLTSTGQVTTSTLSTTTIKSGVTTTGPITTSTQSTTTTKPGVTTTGPVPTSTLTTSSAKPGVTTTGQVSTTTTKSGPTTTSTSSKPTTSTTTKPTTTTVAPCAMPVGFPTNKTNRYPCGTFLKYDPKNKQFDPETYGFPGGINNRDWSITYVGYGDAFSTCSKLNPCPGYIQTTSPNPGAYMACQDTKSELFDNVGAYYLAWHSNLKWVNTTINNANTVPNAIQFTDNGWYLKIGRICSGNRLQVGRFHYVIKELRFMNLGVYTEQTGAFPFQILTC